MRNSFEEAKARMDGDMDSKKRHSTVPSMMGDDEKKKRWSDTKDPGPEKSYPPVDVEIPQSDPPPPIFASYPPRRSRRWGLFIPAWLIALFVLVLAFESTILFAYTMIGLYKETAPVVLSAASAAGLSGSCNCPSFGTNAGINGAPDMIQPSISIMTVTNTPPATQIPQPPIRETSVSTSVSTDSSVSTTTAPGTTTTATGTTTASASTQMVTTTASAPTSTTITTITPSSPPPSTSTTFSTSTIPNTNTPAPEHTIFSTETVAPSSSGKPSSNVKSTRLVIVAVISSSGVVIIIDVGVAAGAVHLAVLLQQWRLERGAPPW
ncbi:MAG: hypothetical protein M1821_003795 [Bathelium mastoideum]|nr:MAG: hypothetical protein M1821_003795 [Bathelium mastoideum]